MPQSCLPDQPSTNASNHASNHASSRAPRAAAVSALVCMVVCIVAGLAACASTPAEPVPFKAVPAERMLQPGYTEPGGNRLAVDLRRERSDDVIVRFRSAQVYVDGERVADLMNGEHITFFLSPGTHRLAVSTQFDPVRELQFVVTADPRYTNRASVTFDHDHRIVLRRVAQ
jgi:hypothetical protein